MKIITITASRSQKINSGNYESQDIFVSMTAEVEITEDISECFDFLFEQINNRIKDERKRRNL